MRMHRLAALFLLGSASVAGQAATFNFEVEVTGTHGGTLSGKPTSFLLSLSFEDIVSSPLSISGQSASATLEAANKPVFTPYSEESLALAGLPFSAAASFLQAQSFSPVEDGQPLPGFIEASIGSSAYLSNVADDGTRSFQTWQSNVVAWSNGFTIDGPITSQTIHALFLGSDSLSWSEAGSNRVCPVSARCSTTFIQYLGTAKYLGLATDAVPEPGTWAMLVLGFGLAGCAARRGGPQRRASHGAAVEPRCGRA